MRSILRSLGLAVVLPTIGAAQIRGVVVEDSTGRPIADAKIEVLGADLLVRATAQASAIGWFELTIPAEGQFLLLASHPAYRVAGSLVVDAGLQQALTVVLRLSGGPIPLDPVVVNVTARNRLSAYRERARKSAAGHFITRADIDKLGGYNLANVLRLTPEVRIERVRDGPFTSDGLFMRSFGGLCVPAVFLDGAPVPTDRVFDINDLLSPEAVEGIEVYRSALSAPMELRTAAFAEWDGSCGVIALWSRRPAQAVDLTPKPLLLTGLLAGASYLLSLLLH